MNAEENDMDEWITRSRIRTKRRRMRMRIEAMDKTLLSMHRQERLISRQIWNLGWTELNPPVQQGFIRFFVLRADVRRTKEAVLFENLLKKINTTQWSYRKDFKKKRKRFGKKVYAVREQELADVEERLFYGKEFNDTERSYFYETMNFCKKRKRHIRVYRISEKWRFVLKVQPNMISRVRIKDLDLEIRLREVDRYFDVDRRHRLWKLLYGSDRWRGDHFPKEKHKHPFQNRSFASILDEHLPGTNINVVCEQEPSEPSRGFLLLQNFRGSMCPAACESQPQSPGVTYS